MTLTYVADELPNSTLRRDMALVLGGGEDVAVRDDLATLTRIERAPVLQTPLDGLDGGQCNLSALVGLELSVRLVLYGAESVSPVEACVPGRRLLESVLDRMPPTAGRCPSGHSTQKLDSGVSLASCLTDDYGVPVPGVVVVATDDDGAQYQGATDDDGRVVILIPTLRSGTMSITLDEESIPAGLQLDPDGPADVNVRPLISGVTAFLMLPLESTTDWVAVS